MPSTPVTIHKLGGSLLDLPDLGARIARVIESDSKSRPLIVVGGGRAADVIRDWDRIHRLGDERAHWLALRAMGLNESLVVELVTDAVLIASRNEAETAWNDGRIPIVRSEDFLRREEAAIVLENREFAVSRLPGASESSDEQMRRASPIATAPLPRTWDVTSDSIAAWIALRWPAERLVLLKSVDAPSGFAPGNCAEDGVDPFFSRVVAPGGLALEWVNLREVGG